MIIAFAGVDGSGKTTTLVHYKKRYYRPRDINTPHYLFTHEPYYPKNIDLIHKSMSMTERALLFAADRARRYNDSYVKDVYNHGIIMTDRSYLCNIVYQIYEQVSQDNLELFDLDEVLTRYKYIITWLYEINMMVPRIDGVVFFNTTPEVCVERCLRRGENISIDKVNALNQLYKYFINKDGCKSLYVSTDNSNETVQDVCEQIHTFVEAVRRDTHANQV